MERIPVAGPWITDREVEYVADAARNGWYEHWSDYNTRFEEVFAEYIGVQYAISLPSCTAAIHLSLAALGVGPGDEVIVPEATWIASAGPATYLGARPVFCDIDPVTWCLTADTVARCLTPRTKAIVAVDLYGGVPDWDSLLAFTDRYGIPVVEDAAEAVGSAYQGRMAGSFGRTGVFSFHGTKTMSTGEGGMLVTDDEAVYTRSLQLRDQGRNPFERARLWNEEVAFKYRMSAVQAALGLAQAERMPELVAKKRLIFKWYQERLEGIPGVTLNAEPAGVTNSYWLPTAVLDRRLGLRKEDLMARLDDSGIDSRPFFYPLSSLPAFADYPEALVARESNAVAYGISPYGINLPGALRLDEADVDRVCRELRALIEGVRLTNRQDRLQP